MQLLIFDLRSSIAHFRRPDTLGTHASYPFITRTALHGLVASVLGLEALPEEPLCGIRLLAPVRSVAQELSLHGKTWLGMASQESSFSRPTSIELMVEPHYRIFYHGPLHDELTRRVRSGKSHYHTYLGSAFCLTFPEFVAEVEATQLDPAEGEVVESASVVPSAIVGALQPQSGDEYARVGGILYQHIGDRRFRGTLNLIYEVRGRPTRFTFSDQDPAYEWRLCRVESEGVVCLW